MNLFPTYTCFTDAAEIMVDRIHDAPERATNGTLFVVHAILMAGDTPYAHAWVEEGEDSRDGEKVCFCQDKPEYYEMHHVQEKTRYTPWEAFLMAKQKGNDGPWEQRYIDRCAKDGETPKDLGVIQGNVVR